MRIISVDEHYATPAFLEASNHPLKYKTKIEPGRSNPGPSLTERLYDIGDLRVGEMDNAGIDVQVLSLTSPGIQQMKADEAAATAREQNDFLADRIKYYPERLTAFAAIPTQNPELAAKELERTVTGFGFKGAAIMGHTLENYMDDGFFFPILEAAAALRVPLFLHPTLPPRKVIEAYYIGNFSPGVANLLSTSAWGWHIDSAIHSIRLVASGVFDRFPDLQIITGHLGEAIPFLLSNIEQQLPIKETSLERSFGDYFRDNFFYTISGYNSLPAFLDLLSQVGAGRILFSTDYPFSMMDASRTFLERLPVCPEDIERIAHSNAERLLQI